MMVQQPVLGPEALNGFLDAEFPELNAGGAAYRVREVSPGRILVTVEAGPAMLRPGGTVSGPTLMTLADVSAWLVVLAHIGPSALTVTTHLSIDFLRKPGPGVVAGRARLLKLGKRLAVADCDIGPEDGGVIYAHASATYSIPSGDR